MSVYFIAGALSILIEIVGVFPIFRLYNLIEISTNNGGTTAIGFEICGIILYIFILRGFQIVLFLSAKAINDAEKTFGNVRKNYGK